MDIREKAIEICFREFCDLAGDSPCGCDGCPYGKYSSENGECYEEYKKDKFGKVEKTGVTVQEWVSATKRLPEHGDVVLCFMKFGEHRMLQWDNVSSLWLGDGHGDDWQKADVTHWMPLPEPPKGE